jgi:hypothetical protein
MQVPAGHSASWAGYTAAPTSSPYAVTGRRFAAVSGDGTALVVGDEGVSLTAVRKDGTQEAATALYRACAAVLNWPDGGRRLIGTDGIVIDVEPGLYGVDVPTMAAVDAAVSPAAVVRLPPRHLPPKAQSAVTQAGNESPEQAAPAVVRRTGPQTAALVVLGLLAGLFAFLALAVTVFGGGDPETSTGEWIAIAGFLWAVTALCAWPAVRILRRTRRA